MPGTLPSSRLRNIVYAPTLIAVGVLLSQGAWAQPLAPVTPADPAISRILNVQVDPYSGRFSLGVADQNGVVAPILDDLYQTTRFGQVMVNPSTGLPIPKTSTSIAAVIDPPPFVQQLGAESVFTTAPLEDKFITFGAFASGGQPREIRPGVIRTRYRVESTPIEIEQLLTIEHSAEETGLEIPDTLRVDLTVHNLHSAPHTVDLRLVLDSLLPARVARRPALGGIESQSTDAVIFATDLADAASAIIRETTLTQEADEAQRTVLTPIYMVDKFGDPALAARVAPVAHPTADQEVLMAGFAMLSAHLPGMQLDDLVNLTALNIFHYRRAEVPLVIDWENTPNVNNLSVLRPNVVLGTPILPEPADSGLIYYWKGLSLAPGASTTCTVRIRPRIKSKDLPLYADEASEFFGTQSVSGPQRVIDRNLYILDRPITFAPGTTLYFAPGKSLYLYSSNATTYQDVTFTAATLADTTGMPLDFDFGRQSIAVNCAAAGTPTPTPTSAPEVTPRVDLELSGNPCLGEFALYVRISGNFTGRDVGLFSFRLELPPGLETTGYPAGMDWRMPPVVERRGNILDIYSQHSQSTMRNGLLFGVSLRSRGARPLQGEFKIGPRPGSWGGIFISEGSVARRPLDSAIRFVNCRIEYAGGEDATRHAVAELLQIDPPEGDYRFLPVPLTTNPRRPNSGAAALTLLQADVELIDCVVSDYAGSAIVGSIESNAKTRNTVFRSSDPNAIDGVTFLTWSPPNEYLRPTRWLRGVEQHIRSGVYEPLRLKRSVTWANTDLPYVPESDIEIPVNITLTAEPPDDATRPVVVEFMELVDFAGGNQFADRGEIAVHGALRVDPDYARKAPGRVSPGVVFKQRVNPWPDPEARPLQPVVAGPPRPDWPPEIDLAPVIVATPTPDLPPETAFLAAGLSAADLAALEPVQPVSAPSTAQIAAPAPQSGAAGNWGGIWFYATSDNAFCRVENALIRDGVVGVYATASSPRIAHCIIERAADYGIFCDRDGNAEIAHTILRHNEFYGLAAVSNAAPHVARCVIRNSGAAGVLVSDRALPILRECDIHDNPLGVDIFDRAAPNLGNIVNDREEDDGRNRFSRNRPVGASNDLHVRNNTDNDIFAQNNFWGAGDPAAVDARIYDDDENPRAGKVLFMPLGIEATPVPSVFVPTATMTPANPPFLAPGDTPTPRAPEDVLQPAAPIQSDLTLAGRVRLERTLTMRGSATLRILAGTQLEVAPVGIDGLPVHIRVENGAALRIDGTRDNPVVITVADSQALPWGGIVVRGESLVLDGHRVQYADISHADIAIDVQGCSPVIDHCRFARNRHAIRVEALGSVNQPGSFKPAAPRIRSCLFTDHTRGASILLLNNAQPDLGRVDPSPALNDPGLNSFYLNDDRPTAFDIVATGLFTLADGSIAAEGNYFTVRLADGRIVTLNKPGDETLLSAPNADPLENRDRLNPAAGRLLDIAPLGKTLDSSDLRLTTRNRQVRLTYVIADERVLQGEVALDHPLLVARTGRVQLLAGTRVRVHAGLQIPISVQGQIEARGSAALPVRFESYRRLPFEAGDRDVAPPRGTDWVGIQFFELTNNEESFLRFCRIQDAQIGVACYAASPTLDRCVIDNIDERGIFVTFEDGAVPPPVVASPTPLPQGLNSLLNSPFNRPAPRIHKCIVSGGDYGLYSVDSMPRVRQSYFTGSLIAGVYVLGPSVPDLGRVDPGAGESGGHNRIDGHVRYNLINHGPAPIRAQVNYWGTTDPTRVQREIFDRGESPRSGVVLTGPELFTAPPTLVEELGDLNGDGEINNRDLIDLMAGWRAVIGNLRYNALADYNDDRVVDNKDLFHLSRQVGRPH